jgi:hypothetical protein
MSSWTPYCSQHRGEFLFSDNCDPTADNGRPTRYVESILENGAMAVHDIEIHKPLVLIAHGADPGHAGCVINDNRWEFRASTTNTFDNGHIDLDTVYASGTCPENLAYDESNPLMFDVGSVLSRSQASITGDEFYDAIPSAYKYQSHFRNYLKTVHEVPDEHSWGGLAYLTRLEVPEGTPDVLGHGYVIHPGMLDSITQCGLAMLINMATKSFDFPGIFLPLKIDALTRWDSRDAPTLDDELKGGIWTYFVTRAWGPNGPFKSDYTIANSAGRVLFTIEGFEIARAPEAEPVVIRDHSINERLTTIWQSNMTFHMHFYYLRVCAVCLRTRGLRSQICDLFVSYWLLHAPTGC